MGRKEKVAAASSLACMSDSETSTQELVRCDCLPFSPLHYIRQQEGIADRERMVPIPPVLNSRMRSVVHTLFPRSTPLSLLLLHICQQEYAYRAEHPELCRYHAPAGVLEQVLTNVRRVIRAEDRQFIQENAGAGIIFPGVEQQGAWSIVERVYKSIDLLQAETLIPPLTRETTIMLGIGSYPDAGILMEDLLYQAGCVVRSLTLRPIITSQPCKFAELRGGEIAPPTSAPSVFPLMELPQELAQDLKHLIPYYLAQELQCIPVGKEHHTLTVAMVDPGDQARIRRLQSETGLNIFPVACRSEELASLLTHRW